MNLRETYRSPLASPTSMGLRITPENRMAVQNSNLFYLQATSAESNVLNVSSSLGHECLVLTKFVKGSPIADFIKRQLRARNIRFEGRGGGAGRPVGLSPSVQHRGLRFWACGRTARVERPRRRGRQNAQRIEDFDVDAHLRAGGRRHPAPVRPDRRHESTRRPECCLALAKGGEAVRHARLLRPQLPRHVLEGPRGRAVQGVP